MHGECAENLKNASNNEINKAIKSNCTLVRIIGVAVQCTFSVAV